MRNPAAELVARCFAARTAAHFAHLKSKGYACHMALNEFYDSIVDASVTRVFSASFRRTRTFRYPLAS